MSESQASDNLFCIICLLRELDKSYGSFPETSTKSLWFACTCRRFCKSSCGLTTYPRSVLLVCCLLCLWYEQLFSFLTNCFCLGGHQEAMVLLIRSQDTNEIQWLELRTVSPRSERELVCAVAYTEAPIRIFPITFS